MFVPLMLVVDWKCFTVVLVSSFGVSIIHFCRCDFQFCVEKICFIFIYNLRIFVWPNQALSNKTYINPQKYTNINVIHLIDCQSWTRDDKKDFFFFIFVAIPPVNWNSSVRIPWANFFLLSSSFPLFSFVFLLRGDG